MGGKEGAYEPLKASSSDNDEYDTLRYSPYADPAKKKMKVLLWVLVAIVFVTNIAWASVVLRGRGKDDHQLSRKIHDPIFSNNPMPNVLRPTHWVTDFSNDDLEKSNPLWRDLFPHGAGLVSVPKKWAIEQELPTTASDPNNSTNGVYFTAAFHQLHCVSVARAALHRYKNGKEQTVPWMHVSHCLDSIRQAIMCSADSTLLYTDDPTGNIFGDGQVHKCRDWEQMVAWVTERHADVN